MQYVDGFIVPVPKKRLNAYRTMARKGRQGLARARRAGLSRMRGGGRQGRQVDVVSAQREAEAGRNCGVFLDYLQVAQASRQGQHQGDEGPAPRRHDGSEGDAVRCQAYDLWRLRGVRQRVIDTDAKEESNDRTWSLSLD